MFIKLFIKFLTVMFRESEVNDQDTRAVKKKAKDKNKADQK